MVPELKGRPKSFTKKTSRLPNNERVEGNKSLKIKSKIPTDKILAIKKLFNLNFLYFYLFTIDRHWLKQKKNKVDKQLLL